MGSMVSQFGNAEFHEKGNFALVALSPKLYSHAAIFSSAYLMLDSAFVIVDGTPDQVVVSLQPKKGKNLKGLVRQFNKYLISHSASAAEAKKTGSIRAELVKRALLTQSKKG
ncbi:MAG: hypothetical protein JW744_02740 [Candidatus Diapherotrites archaeon]|uniref:Uncharacterized protein n=1 Tax=Candidatus Iainarchaeum sp. TaxID=3101447 RepID=A0A938YR52_9ARCH|nr:hypothetical protein [Candidatus Diapherotrites archaeon]